MKKIKSALVFGALLTLQFLTAPLAGAQSFTVLHKFRSQAGGTLPTGALVADSLGNLYGATSYGGAFNFGAVFKLDPQGAETVLHSFSGGDGLGPDGPLILGLDGILYGTTFYGGTPEGGGCKHGCGTVFAVNKSGEEKVLYAFTGGTDGMGPVGGLAMDPKGNLYGTTSAGGNLSCWIPKVGCGVVFKVDKKGTETVLYSFNDQTDGKMPDGVIRDNSGNLYGTTSDGGTFRKGAVFRLDPSGKFTVLYSWSDRATPTGIFVKDSVGNLYGTTAGYRYGDYGEVFKLSTTGKLTVLYHFHDGADGAYPTDLILDKTGDIYGIAHDGGLGSGCSEFSGCGTVFKVDTKGNETTLHYFSGTDGEIPEGLGRDSEGTFYGATLGGGGGKECPNYRGCGTAFKLAP